MMAALVIALVLASGAQAVSLEGRLRAAIAESGAEVAIAVKSLDGRMEIAIDAERRFHAASTMKVPVMIELFRQAKQGTLSLDDSLVIRNEFRSIVDGSPYSLSEGDDSDTEVYAAVGKPLTLRRLCELMITVSSNFATNLLIEKLGVDNIRRTVARLGADGMDVLRGVEDGKAFEKGLNNTTDARGLVVLFDKLAHGQAVGTAEDAAMVDVLLRQHFNDGIPAGLPPNTRVAHKTGNITRIHHDAGIVFGPRPYVVAILVRGIEDAKRSGSLIAELSRTIFDGLSRTTP